MVKSLVALTLAALALPAVALEREAVAVGVFDWIPLDDTLESNPDIGAFRDHYVHRLEVTTINNRFQLAVTLPEDLSAGVPTVLTIPEVSRRNRGEGELEIRFQSAEGNLLCGVGDTWLNASCKVEHLAIPGSDEERRAFTSSKYAGTKKERGLSLVAVLAHAEPFGKISFSDPESLVEGALQGNGHWMSTFQDESGNLMEAAVYLDFSRGTLAFDDRVFLLNFSYFDATAEGAWAADEEDFGWFRLTFSGDAFYGEWGRYPEADVALGTWSGTRRP